MDAVVIVDNVPLVDQAKRDKLLGVIKRIFKNIGNIVEGEEGMFMPMGEDGMSKGYVFSEMGWIGVQDLCWVDEGGCLELWCYGWEMSGSWNGLERS
jgi:hypothetical protein